jgi:cation diffusion facilitator CzcD-associated flavoprotein CzcO
LEVDTDKGTTNITARFLILGTGYYDYNESLGTTIHGLHNFKGQVVHPQAWPEDIDYLGKKIVIIGSGATAITLLPVLADRAAKVTMLQRSPTYVLSQPSVDPIGRLIHMVFPKSLAFILVRWKFLILPFLFYHFCRACPNAARYVLRKRAERQLPKSLPHDPNFNPTYNPWEQRLCVCPDGDFFNALRSGIASVVTDRIKTVTETGITTESGKTLDADIIVTATGLKVQLAGGAKITIKSKPVVLSEKYIWNGQMVQDVPNTFVVMGYTNASWTLGSDSTAMNICRLLKHMDKDGMAHATPRVPEGLKMSSRPLIDLNSTYVSKAKSTLPLCGDRGPWKPRANYIIDYWTGNYRSVTTDMEFTKATRNDKLMRLPGVELD